MSNQLAVLRERVQRAKGLYEDRRQRRRSGDERVTKRMVIDARDLFRKLRAQLERDREAMAGIESQAVPLRKRVQRAKRLYEARRERRRADDEVVTKAMVLEARDLYRTLRAQLVRERKAFQPWMLNGHPGNISKPCRRAIVRATRAGLVVTSTTDGDHDDDSAHYPRNNASGLGEAVDFGVRASEVGSAGAMPHKEKFQRSEFGRGAGKYRELYGPSNFHNVKNGSRVDLIEGSALEQAHDTHVHVTPV